jgi:hypothetical protein
MPSMPDAQPMHNQGQSRTIKRNQRQYAGLARNLDEWFR